MTDLPRGATIQKASVQFNADELDRAEATDTIRAEAADNSADFTGTPFNLSGIDAASGYTGSRVTRSSRASSSMRRRGTS